MRGNVFTNPNYGQMVAANGPNTFAGDNGCVYPASVQTLFNQLDAAHVSWKGYAQDLGNPDASGSTHAVGTQSCGAPYASPGPAPSSTRRRRIPTRACERNRPVRAQALPVPVVRLAAEQSGDCDSQHIANLFDSEQRSLPRPAERVDDAGVQLDQRRTTAPTATTRSATATTCRAASLDPNTPKPPVNYTGGLYSADLFLEHVIPEIEASPAFRDGGLIDVTFDEGFPPFTYTGNSFANSTSCRRTRQTSIADDSAAETRFGRPVHWEPTGPNTPLRTDPSTGQELFPGPGDNAFVDRPSNCVAQTLAPQKAGTCLLGGGSNSPGSRTDAAATAAAGSDVIDDNSVVATNNGRTVTGNGSGRRVRREGHRHADHGDRAERLGRRGRRHRLVHVGQLAGHPLYITGPVTSVTLGQETPAPIRCSTPTRRPRGAATPAAC